METKSPELSVDEESIGLRFDVSGIRIVMNKLVYKTDGGC
jgi:hypothetical protein